MKAISDLPVLDYTDPAYQAEPFLWLARKAADVRLARSERGVEILDYDLCRAFLLDRDFGTDLTFADVTHNTAIQRLYEQKMSQKA